MNIRKLIATATVAVLAGGGLALATALPASAHTPEITDTCNSISANLTNYEYIPGAEAEFKTVVVTPAVPAVPEVLEVLGDPPLISAAVPAVTTVENEYTKETGVYGESMTKWFPENANPQGWVATGNFRIVEITPAQPAVYGPQPVLVAYQPAIPAVAEVTEQVEIKAAVPAQDNSIQLILDGVDQGTARFGTSYSNTVQIDGTVNHEYTVIIDAIGTAYDKTITGSTTACPVPNALFLSHTQSCGTVDITLRNVSPWIYPTSVKIDGVHSYGPTVDNRTNGGLGGPQKDQSKTRTISFAEDTGTHTVEYRIDAGSENSLYKGTALNEWVVLTVDTDCEPPVVIVPEQPEPTVTVETTEVVDCETSTVEITTTTTTTTTVYDEESNTWITGDPIVEVTTDTREATAEECPVVVPPVDEPETPVTPEEPVTPVDEPLGQGGDEGLNETLAQTGSTLPIAAGVLAILAIAAGTGALVLRRRQHAAE